MRGRCFPGRGGRRGVIYRFLLLLEEVVALLIGDGEGYALHYQEDVFPDFAFFGERLVSEQVGGVIGGHEGDALELVPAAAEAGHGLDGAEEAFHGDGAEGDEDGGLDGLDLGAEVGKAGLHLEGGGAAVAGGAGGHVGTAFEDVGDEDVGAGEAHGFDDFGEELAGFADEGLALEVFIGAGGFAYEHDAGVDIADAEDGLGAGAGELGALCAGGDGGAELVDAVLFGGAGGGEDVEGRG